MQMSAARDRSGHHIYRLKNTHAYDGKEQNRGNSINSINPKMEPSIFFP